MQPQCLKLREFIGSMPDNIIRKIPDPACLDKARRVCGFFSYTDNSFLKGVR